MFEVLDADAIPLDQRIPEVVRRLEAVQEVAAAEPLREHDGVACFNFLYKIITQQVQVGVLRGDFQDNDFITRLDVEFANRYLNALNAYGKPGAPRSWSLLMDNRNNDAISPLRFAIAGVCAHVVYDLPFALLASCDGHHDLLTRGYHHDYQAINSIFAKEMRPLRMHLESFLGKKLDVSFLSTLENLIGNWVVRRTRNQAWHRATRELWPERHNFDRLGRSEQDFDEDTADINRLLLTPGLLGLIRGGLRVPRRRSSSVPEPVIG